MIDNVVRHKKASLRQNKNNMDNPETIQPEFTKIADNIKGAEGPVFDKNGKFYMVAPEVMDGDKNAGEVLSVNLENGEVSVACKPVDSGCGGVPAGCQCDQDNNIWIADMRLGILKMDSSGNYKQMFKVDSEGRTMQGCNDCIFDYDGNLWITAPAGDIAPAPYTRSMEEPFGSVYCLTKDQTLIRIEGKLRFPNGLAVLHDSNNKPQKLIVAETPTKTLWQYDILGPGKVGPRSVWGKCPGDHEGGPDGMDFDDNNNLVVANWGSGHLEVFSSAGGEPITRIKCPFQNPSNIHFVPGTGDGRHGPDGMDFDADNNLIVAHHRTSHLEVFSVTGGSPFLRIKCPFEKPSNVHFKHGTSAVYVTEHSTHALWKFEWRNKDNGTNNGPDGVDFDDDNNLIVTDQRSGFLEVFPQTGGSPVARIKCPFFRPSNVHFKPGSSTIYVTEHEFHGLWKFEWRCKGKKQYCEMA